MITPRWPCISMARGPAWNIASSAEMPGRPCPPRPTQPSGAGPVTWCSVSGFAAACPVLCSGNGQYSKGTCQCYSGWKGAECDVPTNQCIEPSCGGHGSCIDGNCVCSAGYKGEHCEEGRLLRAGRGACAGPHLGSPAGPGLYALQRKPNHCTDNFKPLGFEDFFLFFF